MKVTILGSGSFISSLDRFGPSFLLEFSNNKILIDAGSGCQLRLLEKDIKLEDLDYIFITHFHPDHTTDLLSILVRYKMLVRTNPNLKNKLKVIGPKGFENFINNLFKIYELPQFIDFPGAEISSISEKFELDDFSVEPFAVEHLGIIAQAYRFETEGKTIVFSGDTSFSDGIVKATNNADIAFIDTSLNKEEKPLPHLNTSEVGKLCSRSNVKKVVLIHILNYNEKRDLIGEVKENYSGEIVLSKDLMEIEI